MIELISDRFNKRKEKRKVLSIGQHLFVNHTCTLNERRLKTQPEFSVAW